LDSRTRSAMNHEICDIRLDTPSHRSRFWCLRRGKDDTNAAPAAVLVLILMDD